MYWCHLLAIVTQCTFILAPPTPAKNPFDELMSPAPSFTPVKLWNNDDPVQIKEVVKENPKVEKTQTKKASNPFDFSKILNDDKYRRFLQGFGLDVAELKELSKLHDVDEIKEALDDDEFTWKISGNVLDFLHNYVDSVQKMEKMPKKFNDVMENTYYVEMLKEHGITEDILANMSKITKEKKFSDVLNDDQYADFLRKSGVNVEMLRNQFQVWGNIDLSSMKNKFSNIASNQKNEIFKNFGIDDPKDSNALKKAIYKYPTKYGLKLPADGCKNNDNEEGDCMTGSECQDIGGQVSGSCHKGYDYSPFPRICCLHKKSCGGITKKTVSYFTSDNLDKGSCSMEIWLAPNTCQVRLDFIQLRMGKMLNGQCPPTDSLQIRTNIKNSYIPVNSMCGNINSDRKIDDETPHLYLHVGVDNPNTPRIIALSSEITSARNMWKVKVSQIQCNGAQLQAPSGCAQYYTQEFGSIASLNYFDGSYPINADLTVCIKPKPACAIQYNLSPFMLDDERAATGRINYGLMCSDYIAFAGEKIGLCGYSGATQVTLPADGVQGFTFRSDGKSGRNEVGFVIQYRFRRSCNGLNFFNYPVPKENQK